MSSGNKTRAGATAVRARQHAAANRRSAPATITKPMRRKPKLDTSHKGIVEALERAGARVQSFASMGSGVPDLYCTRAGNHYWIECKPPGPPSTQKLRDSQIGWAEKMGLTVYVVSTPEQALEVMNEPRCVDDSESK